MPSAKRQLYAIQGPLPFSVALAKVLSHILGFVLQPVSRLGGGR